MNLRSNRIQTAIVFGVLWAAGILFWSPSIDLQTVGLAVIVGAIAGLFAYWVFDMFDGRLRG